jgi:uncharacterized membrane protein
VTERTAPASGTATAPRRTARSRGGNGLSGALFGIAVAGFVDEAVFHQILHWHKFYDRSTTEVGLVSDGLFHAFSFFAAVAGLFLLAELRRRGELVWPRWIGAALVGAGAFQLYDGTIQHKLMGLHQIRYQVDLLPYDLAWILVAVALIVAGTVLLVRTRAPAGERHAA